MSTSGRKKLVRILGGVVGTGSVVVIVLGIVSGGGTLALGDSRIEWPTLLRLWLVTFFAITGVGFGIDGLQLVRMALLHRRQKEALVQAVVSSLLVGFALFLAYRVGRMVH